MSVPLFIFAATFFRFIGDHVYGHQDKLLNEALEFGTKSQESQSIDSRKVNQASTTDSTTIPPIHGKELLKFLHDAEYFTHAYTSAIDTCPLQIY
ncbi:unnamed protein product [Clonostachys rhizophaga]|uniref:Uncharacterized protein n=1 Tax=Clonostachys rhizophaga TaxID=160324 RepID=A0A9N9YII8_9HYPO|nr:unnamed protein product [Clonostachys rhizophaga]